MMPTLPALVKPVEKALPDFLSVFKQLRILLYGDTGDGKTTQIGEFAEYLYLKTKQKTRLHTADRGGLRTIQPHIELGLIEVETWAGSGLDPFVWLQKSTQGYIWRGNRWIDGRSDAIGLYAFDSISAIAEELHKNVRDSQFGATPIGPKAYHFDIGVGDDKIGVGTTDKGHIGIIQGQVMDAFVLSQLLPGHLIWTAAMRRETDDATKGPVLGPQVLGRALTTILPSKIEHTWRISAVPVANQHPEHVLFLDDHLDSTAIGAKGLGNARNPLAGATEAPVPASIKPASIVKALGLLAARQGAAKNDLKTRMGL